MIARGLTKNRRPEDGLLHASGDILGSLRHAQLRLAGAPSIENELVQEIRLMTGTLWHKTVHQMFVDEGLAVMGEVRLKDYLPEGWTGTADWLFWDFKKRCFVLGDLKTTRGEGMFYIEKDGAKAAHIAQLSAYYHACVAAGMPIKKGFFICYMPMNPDGDKRMEHVEITRIDCRPMAKEDLWLEMEDRWTKVQTYLAALRDVDVMSFNRQELAPPMEREQKLYWDKKVGIYNLKLVPNWLTKFCPYADELCDCSTQGETKIGEYNVDGEYSARKGYEEVLPQLAPKASELLLRKAA